MIRLKHLLEQSEVVTVPKATTSPAGELILQDPETQQRYFYRLQPEDRPITIRIIEFNIKSKPYTITYIHPFRGKMISEFPAYVIGMIAKKYKDKQDIEFETDEGDRVELHFVKQI